MDLKLNLNIVFALIMRNLKKRTGGVHIKEDGQNLSDVDRGKV